MSSAAASPRPIARTDEARVLLTGRLGAILRLAGAETGAHLAFVEHPLAPHSLGCPVHTHEREDEYSYVLEGTVGAEVGGRTVVAHAGDIICKPRGIPHAFWNPSDLPARILEVITPAGFEGYFARLAEIHATGSAPDRERMAALWREYRLDMDPTSIERLCRAHDLRFGA